MTKKICISGYYGFENFGDETILKILCENLKRFECNPDITVFSKNPQTTAKNHNVKSIQTFDIKSVIKTVFESDVLISGGGSLLQDVSSAKSLLYYLFVLFIGILFKKKIIVFAQGIGPINNPVLKKITLMILKRAKYITVRDERSYELLKENGIECKICSDPVWNLEINKTDKSSTFGKTVVQLRQYPHLNLSFIKNLAVSLNKYYGHKEIILLSLQNQIDLIALEKLKNELFKINPEIKAKIIPALSNEQIINDIANADEIIAMRYHACIIAIKSGVKLLPVNYDIKVETLAKEFSLNCTNPNSSEYTESDTEKFANSTITYNKNVIKSKIYDFEALEKEINQETTS